MKSLQLKKKQRAYIFIMVERDIDIHLKWQHKPKSIALKDKKNLDKSMPNKVHFLKLSLLGLLEN